MKEKIHFVGKVVITGSIRLVTGLHIGGASAGLDIGGIDNPIIRHPVTREPYIPGSSLRGKMRSLLERAYQKPLNKRVQDVRIHECYQETEYKDCFICHIFGVSPGELERGVRENAQQGARPKRRGEWDSFKPTRLVVRDVMLSERSKRLLEQSDTDLPYAEVKWEAAIDRITAAAVPRQNERVPAGAIFEPLEIVYSIYSLGQDDWKQDVDWLCRLFEAMRLLEDDYLGGYGSRGSGQIVFKDIRAEWRPRPYYTEIKGAKPLNDGRIIDLRDSKQLEGIVKEVLQDD